MRRHQSSKPSDYFRGHSTAQRVHVYPFPYHFARNVPSKVPTTGDTCSYPVDFCKVTGSDDCSPGGRGIFAQCSINGVLRTQYLEPGRHTITCKVSDYSGNEGPYSTCFKSFEVYDPKAPELKCPSTVMVDMYYMYGACHATAIKDNLGNQMVVRAEDECGLDDWNGIVCKDVGSGAEIPLVKDEWENRAGIDTAQAYNINSTYKKGWCF